MDSNKNNTTTPLATNAKENELLKPITVRMKPSSADTLKKLAHELQTTQGIAFEKALDFYVKHKSSDINPSQCAGNTLNTNVFKLFATYENGFTNEPPRHAIYRNVSGTYIYGSQQFNIYEAVAYMKYLQETYCIVNTIQYQKDNVESILKTTCDNLLISHSFFVIREDITNKLYLQEYLRINEKSLIPTLRLVNDWIVVAETTAELLDKLSPYVTNLDRIQIEYILAETDNEVDLDSYNPSSRRTWN